MMVLLAIYMFMMPFKMFYINVLECVVLADVVLLLLIASTDNFKVYNKFIQYLSTVYYFDFINMQLYLATIRINKFKI